MSVRQLLQACAGIGMLFGVALLFAPFLPSASIALQPGILNTTEQVLGVSTSSAAESEQHFPTDNRLIIPSIGVDAIIHEGATESTLSQGVWRIPTSSTPDKGSNTVLTAHRWQWLTGANTFYHLNKLKTGDSISVLWQGQKFLFRVSAVTEVTSNDMTIEAPTDAPILTLYTCKLWWEKDARFVVVAEQI